MLYIDDLNKKRTWICLADFSDKFAVEARNKRAAHWHQVVLIRALDEKVEPADPGRLVDQVAALTALHSVRVIG